MDLFSHSLTNGGLDIAVKFTSILNKQYFA